MTVGHSRAKVQPQGLAGSPTVGNHRMLGPDGQSVGAMPKKIWIDLDNSPHVPFFAPIIHELENRGYLSLITARDCFQLFDLADLHGFTYTRVGRHYGKHKVLKVLGTGIRSLELLPIVRREKPDLAVSHGSRSQLATSILAGIPSVLIFDYEFVKFLPGLNPTCVMIPEVIPDSAVHCSSRVLKYPGIKEDVYVPSFKPDHTIKGRLGLNAGIIVTLRPPANEAHYHNPDSERLLEATMDVLGRTADTQVVLLPRNEKQAASLRNSWANLFSERKVIIPDRVVDGLNLVWHSDLVISGGGTMNREAAALGVPVYSIFRGTIGAVDRYLANSGRLVLLQSVDDVRTKLVVKRRDRPIDKEITGRGTLDSIVNQITAMADSKWARIQTTKLA